MAFNINRFVRSTLAFNSGAETLEDASIVGGPAIYSYQSASDTVATILGSNYFANDAVLWDLHVGDFIICNGSDASIIAIVATIDPTAGTVTTDSFGAAGPVGTADIEDGAVTYAKLSAPIATTSTGLNVTYSGSSATPGTIRTLKGVNTGTATTMTSGNLVGVRGEVDCVGASGGFLYGAQGKVIPTGTLSGSVWCAGVFGQLDISAATINAGQCAPIWGDYGASSGTLTNQTGLYGIAMTNTTAVVTAAQLYLYGGASALMKLETNAGLSGVTYFINAGTSAGSWGNATPPTPSKVLKITVDGTAYYLPLVAQNT